MNKEMNDVWTLHKNRFTARAVGVALCVAFLGLVNADRALAQQPPAPWVSSDIGSPAIAGSTSYTSGTFTIKAAGQDIWGSSDQFRFVYQQITGDVEVIARVDSVTKTASWSKAGVMIRASLSAGSAHGYSVVSAGSGAAFQRRTANGGKSVNTAGPFVAPPEWVRITRVGTRVTAFTSADGTTWAMIGSDTIALGSSAYVGLAVTSHKASALTTAMASQVIVRPLTVPTGQTAVDIGSPAIPGTASYTGGTYAINAAGLDIWNTADQFHFVYQKITGDVDVAVRVRSVSNANSWSKTGVMIRETLAAGSRHAFALASAGGGYGFHRRIDPNGYTDASAGVSGVPPVWVRLVRTGSTIEAFRSTDGATWTSMGTDVVPMVDTVYVGIATTSHNTSATTSAVVDNFKLTAAASSPTPAPSNQAPTVTLTAPANGATYAAPASVALSASAADADGSIAKVEFYSGSTLLGTDTSSPYSFTWSSVPAGTYSLKAVAYDNAGAATTSSAASITVSSSTSTAIPAPWTAADIGAPALAGSSTYSNGVFTVNAAGSDIWNTSDQFRFVYQALSGDVEVIARVDSLTNVHAYTNAGVMIRGSLAANAIHGYSAVTAAQGVFFRRRVTAGDITTSTLGASTAAPTWVRLVRQGSLVTSYRSADGSTWTAIGSQTLALGSTAYVGLAVSSHDVTARTTANFSNVRVTPLSTSTNKPPTVTLTAPAGGSTYVAPASVALTASAADSDGSIAKVEFYSGTTLLGTDTTAPYSFTWSSVAAGTYSLTAVAYDNAGAKATSAAASITVSSSTTTTAPTKVSFTASTDHATVTSYRLNIYTSSANTSTATPVATSDLGKPTPDSTNTITVDRATFFAALAAGSYQATVSAISSGGSTQSAPTAFTR